jgi:hypothetical protein
MAVAWLFDHFPALGDPRQSWKVVYPLPEYLLVVLRGAMAGGRQDPAVGGVQAGLPVRLPALRPRCARA